MPLASSQDFLAASKANPVFAKYAGKPSGLQSKAPAPINTQAANNGTASGSNHAVSNVSTAQAGPLNGTSSGNIIFEAPISASEKMSALTHSSKVDFALDAEMQKLKSEFITLLDKIADLAKKTAATVPVTQPTPPDTPLEALAPQPTENKKAKVCLLMALLLRESQKRADEQHRSRFLSILPIPRPPFQLHTTSPTLSRTRIPPSRQHTLHSTTRLPFLYPS